MASGRSSALPRSRSHIDEVDALTPERREVLKGLERVTSLMVDARSSRAALERVGLVLTEVLHAERWSIMLRTELDVIRISLAKGLPKEVIQQTQLKLGEGIAGRVARDASPVLYRNVQYELGMTSGGSYGSQSAISVPIVLRGSVLGVINLSEKRTADGSVGEFDEFDLTLALMAANQAALMIDIVGALKTASPDPEVEQYFKQRFRQSPYNSFEVLMQASAFDLLSRVTDLMTVSGDLDQVLGAALNGACDLLNASRGSVMLCDRDQAELRVRASIGLQSELAEQVRVKPGHGIAGRVLQSGEALLLANAPQARLGRPNGDPQSERYRNQSALCVPLAIHGRVLGVINLNDRRDERDFSDNDLYIARVIANQAAVAISAAQLLKESVEAAEIQRLMDLAHDIQANLLPAQPNLAGVDVAGRSEPCASAGGDYIDYFEGPPIASDRPAPLYLACGDVSGHGVGAALIMAMGRAFLRALLRQNRDLASVMYEMNNLIEADTPTGQFMTLFVGVLEPDTGRLRYASAGHDPALLYRARTDEVSETKSTGLPLGMFEKQDYEVSELAIEPGDLLMLSTDGIAEASDLHGSFYGRERVKQDLRELHGLSSAEVVGRVEERVLDFTRPKALTDDLSLIVAQLHRND